MHHRPKLAEKHSVCASEPLHGFTLVELLVVIAIIGILVALLLPAVQAAREAARRSTCTNNLKQLGLAVQMFSDANKTYPAGSYWYDADTSCIPGTTCKDRRGTLQVHILPYMEQQALYDRFDFSKPTDDQLMPDGSPIGSVEIATFKCPSSEHPTLAVGALPESNSLFESLKMTNYGASRGNTKQITNPACSCSTWNSFNGAIGNEAVAYPDFNPLLWPEYGGPFSRGWNGAETSAKQITDGLSNTIFLGEVRPECSHNFARGWSNSNAGQGVVSTIIPINYDSCSQDHPDRCRQWCNFSTELGFKSAHPGGAYFSMGDASVPFINETIDIFTYNRLGGKADGQIISYGF